jgi:hypothetical protein
MAGITLEQAETQLNLYITAEAAVLSGQRFRIGDKDITRADLEMVQRGITTWEARVQRLTRSATGAGIRTRQVVPV